MPKLTTYIEYLLMTRHYCYVPGHGAYMLADQPALLDSVPGIWHDSRRAYKLQAPRRAVHFSPLHTHDDGILASLLMEAEGMTYDEAIRYIEGQVSQLDADYASQALCHTDTDNLGFEDLHLELWADLEARLNTTDEEEAAAAQGDDLTISRRHDPNTVSIPKVWLQRAAVAVLIAVFFFTNFIGLNQGQVQLASVIDGSMLQRPTFVAGLNDGPEAEEEPECGVSIPEAEPVSAPAAVAPAASPSASQAAAPRHDATEARPFNTTRYYVIIASCSNEADALTACDRFHRKGMEHVGIIASPNNKVHRIFSDSFTDKDEAIRHMHDLRQQSERLSKAWLLTMTEDQSLSYIIKNIYNDNQLSMELSHPNQRTERDQG